LQVVSDSTGITSRACKQVWAYRWAAWAIEDPEQDVGLAYRQMGRKGLESVENVGPRLAEVVEGFASRVDITGA